MTAKPCSTNQFEIAKYPNLPIPRRLSGSRSGGAPWFTTATGIRPGRFGLYSVPWSKSGEPFSAFEGVVWFGVFVAFVLVRCPECRRWTVPRRLREVPTFLEESGRYAVVRVCPTCWPRLFEKMESDLFQFMDPAKRLEPFLELLRDSNVEVPASTDWRATRRWMKEGIDAFRAAQGA